MIKDTPASPAENQPATPSAVPALDRALDLLETVAAAPPHGIAFGDLVKRLRLPPASTTRLLQRLVARRYLAKIPHSGHYQLGHAVSALLRCATREERLLQFADPRLRRLRDAAANTTVLFLREEATTRCALRHLHENSRVMQEPGSRRRDLLNYPWGWIFATALPATVRHALEEPWTMTDVTLAEYQRGLEHYQRHGYSFDCNPTGRWTRFAAPVRDADGEVLAAVGLGLNRADVTEPEIHRLGGMVKDCAAELTHLLAEA